MVDDRAALWREGVKEGLVKKYWNEWINKIDKSMNLNNEIHNKKIFPFNYLPFHHDR